MPTSEGNDTLCLRYTLRTLRTLRTALVRRNRSGVLTNQPVIGRVRRLRGLRRVLTIPLSVIQLALAIIDCLVVEAERFHANTDDLEAQAIAKFKEQAPIEWTWDKFKGKCNDPIRREGVKLWRNIVTAMRDAGIGEVTKSKPLTFRRHTDVDGHRRMSA